VCSISDVLPVIAVGNEGPNTSRSPGNYASVLSVGAVGANDEVPDCSSSRQFVRFDSPLCPDVVAPGVHILSSVPDGTYKIMNGSSMATPHRFGFMLRSAAAADRSMKPTGRACGEHTWLGFRQNALRLLHRSQHSVEHISSHMPLAED
jgi:Subtilase family